jgi:hypothetical protein
MKSHLQKKIIKIKKKKKKKKRRKRNKIKMAKIKISIKIIKIKKKIQMLIKNGLIIHLYLIQKHLLITYVI